MSVTKNQPTKYHETDQVVKFKLTWLRLDNVDDVKNIIIAGGLNGSVGNAPGTVDKKEARVNLGDIKAEFTAQEKAAAKLFLAACERVLAKRNEDLINETHDDTDVFVDNSGE